MDTTGNAAATLVIVPVYNAAEYLPELFQRLRAVAPDHHLLFVNDGSRDHSLNLIKEAHVNYITFPRNRGKGAALMAGFDYAVQHNYRSVVTIDADLQHPPENLPEFFELDNGRRLVIGTRSFRLRIMPFERWLTNNLCSLIISVFSARRVRDSQSGYRLIPTALLKALPLKTISYDLESEMLFKAGAIGIPIAEVRIPTIYEGSHSFINPVKETLRFIRQIWRRVWC